MKWFKFYGQDFMADSKIAKLNSYMRICWIYLLCLTDYDTGEVKYLEEESLIRLAGIYKDEDIEKARGCLQVFQNLEMIEIDGDVINVINWNKRQTASMSGYERLKKWRENHPEKVKEQYEKIKAKKRSNLASNDNEANAVDNSLDKTRQDKINNYGAEAPINNTKKLEPLEPKKKREESQEVRKTNGLSSVADIISKKKFEVIENKQPSGISYDWQEKALRYAKDLNLVLGTHAKGRWMKIFKQASEGRKAKNLEEAYSFIVDYPKPLTNEQKMMFFFKIYECGKGWMKDSYERR
jgi:hypothetical protein